ncbi:MAG: precorrin-3B C(17)-methyltransferase [Deltaproteobacteria bacterium]|nr:precorrin-3B C(17)-methyltransferase [Deltaproteobacteria bacterium]
MQSNNSYGIREKQGADGQKQKPKHDVGHGPGKLTIVSLGPGNSQYLAPKAKTALEQAEVVVGYKTYMNLIDPELIKGKETLSTGMTGEIRRCRMAIDQALGGKNTVIVSSGDSGIYGMAGLVLELLADQGFLDTVEVEVIPGIPALSAAAALLGAPIMHDFAVISLSDLMTPWNQIQDRVEAAARTDFVLVIYNPKSKKRDWQLGSVRDAILKYRDGDTPVGIVRNAAREGESVRITTLSQIDESAVDMLSILLVGNSKTCIMGGKMVTPRGYLEKYGKQEGLLNMDKRNE